MPAPAGWAASIIMQSSSSLPSACGAGALASLGSAESRRRRSWRVSSRPEPVALYSSSSRAGATIFCHPGAARRLYHWVAGVRLPFRIGSTTGVEASASDASGGGLKVVYMYSFGFTKSGRSPLGLGLATPAGPAGPRPSGVESLPTAAAAGFLKKLDIRLRCLALALASLSSSARLASSAAAFSASLASRSARLSASFSSRSFSLRSRSSSRLAFSASSLARLASRSASSAAFLAALSASSSAFLAARSAALRAFSASSSSSLACFCAADCMTCSVFAAMLAAVFVPLSMLCALARRASAE